MSFHLWAELPHSTHDQHPLVIWTASTWDQLNESSPDLLPACISVRPPSPFVFITVAVYTYLVCFSLFHSACFKGTTFTLKAKRFYVLIMLTFHSFATSWRETTSSGNAGDTLLTCACQWGHLTVSRPVWTGHYQSVSQWLTSVSSNHLPTSWEDFFFFFPKNQWFSDVANFSLGLCDRGLK